VTEPNGPTPPQPDEGRLVADRYRLADVIGVGGMATVHRATDTKLDRTVAVKLLRREVVADADIAMRFRREALAATVLRHPNIVACLETGTDDGQPFLVMELIEGEDLAARLRRIGRLGTSEAARIALDVARALGVAHTRGIVHRDIKPGNILLARDGRAMVTDFGIARLAADTEGAIPGTTLGSVHYFSPEQAKGETTTGASDVYSVGLVLYEALTGRRAWSGETTAALAAVRIGADAPSPRAIRADIPAALDAVVLRALDPEPARRYSSGNAMAAALEPIVARPDPASPTMAVPTATLMAGTAAAGGIAAGGVGGTGSQPANSMASMGGATHRAVAPPLRPASTAGASRPADPSSLRRASPRRASPAIAGPFLVLVVVAVVVAGGLFVASLPGPRDPAVAALATATPDPTRTPVATARPASTPVAKPSTAPDPTPVPRATPRPAAKGSHDLCDPILGFACGLDKGTYDPSRFEPAIRFKLRDGWSASMWQPDLIALRREQGAVTFASGVISVFPEGDAVDAPRSARSLVEDLIGTDGVAAGRPHDIRVDKRRARVVDLAPTGPDRVPLFGVSSQTYYLEPAGTTRIVVVDGKDGPLVIAIEPTEDSSLEALLGEADRVVDSVRFR
jgi:tRNA A-37 threonylcarbamoyl transferase component Bud32